MKDSELFPGIHCRVFLTKNNKIMVGN